MYDKKTKNYIGFSMIELVIAIFILSVVMLAAVSVFAKVILVRKDTNDKLNNVSAGREVLQVIAKNMRVSSWLTVDTSNKVVYLFNDSIVKCISYRFYNSSIEVATATPVDTGFGVKSCVSGVASYSSYAQMINPDVTIDGLFTITPTSAAAGSKVVGRGTITMTIDGDNLQTTVSFLTYDGVI